MKTVTEKMKKAVIGFLGVGLLATAMQAHAGDIVTYVQTDTLGNPVTKTDSTGTVIWRQSYTPYGQTYLHADPAGPGFTGHRNDPATGLVYMQARYYDPKIGRFLSVDPVGFSPKYPQFFNRYWYVQGNPYKYKDPTGMFQCNDKEYEGSCAAGEKIRKQWKKAQKHYKKGSKAYKKIQNLLKAFGTVNDGNNVTVRNITDYGDNALARGAGSKKTGKILLIILANNISSPNLSRAQNLARLAASGAHELTHGLDDVIQGNERDYSNEFWHEVRGVRAETAIWEGLGVSDPDWSTWTQSGGLSMHQVFSEAAASANSYCPNNQCP